MSQSFTIQTPSTDTNISTEMGGDMMGLEGVILSPSLLNSFEEDT